MHLLVFEKSENKKPGRSALCQSVGKCAYQGGLVTHVFAQIDGWLAGGFWGDWRGDAMHLLVFEKSENKKPGRSALCQIVRKRAYTSELVTHVYVQSAAWLIRYEK